MKVAVTSRGRTLNDEVDPRFGRANMFLVVDTDAHELEIVDNEQNLEAAQGAGIQAARLVAERGADVVITGHCGPKAFRTLSAAGIKVVVGAEGTVAEALEKFKAGDLRPADDADVEGHWT
jgi:predicted Fe-Mo cluster-binding NifX family protein